jgi:hypothetical protein
VVRLVSFGSRPLALTLQRDTVIYRFWNTDQRASFVPSTLNFDFAMSMSTPNL